jgi:hypothetical protein
MYPQSTTNEIPLQRKNPGKPALLDLLQNRSFAQSAD